MCDGSGVVVCSVVVWWSGVVSVVTNAVLFM